MADFFNWLVGGSVSSILFIVIVSVLGLSIPAIFIVAFSQGREITIWPPKIGEKPNKLLEQVSKDVKALVTSRPYEYSHLRYYRDREEFNKLGIEILHGATSGDTVYIILRTGTFIKEFADALEKFRSYKDSHMIVIVPDSKIFLARFGGALQTWITQLYENPRCGGIRGLMLEPGKGNPSETRMKGYMFMSDGHTFADDDGFYTKTILSSKFLLSYCKMLVLTGKQINFKNTKSKTSKQTSSDTAA